MRPTPGYGARPRPSRLLGPIIFTCDPVQTPLLKAGQSPLGPPTTALQAIHAGLPIFVSAGQMGFLIAHPTSLAMTLAGRTMGEHCEVYVALQKNRELWFLGETRTGRRRSSR